MFHGVSHVEIPCSDLERSAALYGATLGFPERRRGDGYVDFEAGAVLLRLVETKGEITSRPRIRIQVRLVEDAIRAISAAGGARLHDPERTPELEEVGFARDPDGNVLILHRSLSEDEYGFVPSLPKDRAWDPEAEALVQRLLSHVPALFRGLARRKVARVAEELSIESGARTVGREQVIRGLILSSARVTRGRTRAPLIAEGIDPDLYRDDFES